MHLKDYKFLLRLNILVHLLVKHRGSLYPYTIITWPTTFHESLSQASSFKANRHTISEKRHHANLLLNRSTVEVRSVGPSNNLTSDRDQNLRRPLQGQDNCTPHPQLQLLRTLFLGFERIKHCDGSYQSAYGSAIAGSDGTVQG